MKILPRPSPLGKVAAKLTDEVLFPILHYLFQFRSRTSPVKANRLDTLPKGEGSGELFRLFFYVNFSKILIELTLFNKKTLRKGYLR